MKSCFLLSQTGRDSQHQEIYQLQSVNLSRFANFSCPKNYKDRMLFPSMYQHYHYHILSTCISSVSSLILLKTGCAAHEGQWFVATESECVLERGCAPG